MTKDSISEAVKAAEAAVSSNQAGIKSKKLPNASPLELAKATQIKRLEDLRARERLLPCIRAYDVLLDDLRKQGVVFPEKEGLSHLTTIFLGSYKEVLQQIEDNGKTGIAQQNAIKRSAGTNYQGLCEYAVLRWLQTSNLPVAIGPNAPKSMKDELTIHGEDADTGQFQVEPDIDISLWVPDRNPLSPILFISAKTSLVDRAGQAARWKLYLDLHQTACTYTNVVSDCPIHRTKIKIRTKHPIVHSIVTANIYKMHTTQPHGELESGQCRNNTYMFKHKYTTRNDDREVRPASWQSFSSFPDLVEQTFNRYLSSLPLQGAAQQPPEQPLQQMILLEPTAFSSLNGHASSKTPT